MNKELLEKIKSNPDYKLLISKRTPFAIKLSLWMLSVYFAFILTIAFKPSLLAQPLFEDSVITVGIPIGIFIIIFAFILTGIYTFRANTEFDNLTKKIKQSLKED